MGKFAQQNSDCHGQMDEKSMQIDYKDVNIIENSDKRRISTLLRDNSKV